MEESNQRRLSKMERDIEMRERISFEFKKAVIWMGTFFAMLLIFQIISGILGIGFMNAMLSEMRVR